MLQNQVDFRARAYGLLDQVMRAMKNDKISDLRVKIDDNECLSFFVLAADGMSYLSENPAVPVNNNE